MVSLVMEMKLAICLVAFTFSSGKVSMDQSKYL